MKTNLQIIHEAVVEAIPEAMGNWSGCNVCGMACDACDAVDKEKRLRPITLADVLRTMEGSEYKVGWESDRVNDVVSKWNLTLSLDSQSPETLQFLADLLGKK